MAERQSRRAYSPPSCARVTLSGSPFGRIYMPFDVEPNGIIDEHVPPFERGMAA